MQHSAVSTNNTEWILSAAFVHYIATAILLWQKKVISSSMNLMGKQALKIAELKLFYT